MFSNSKVEITASLPDYCLHAIQREAWESTNHSFISKLQESVPLDIEITPSAEYDTTAHLPDSATIELAEAYLTWLWWQEIQDTPTIRKNR